MTHTVLPAVPARALFIIGWEWGPVAGVIVAGGSCLASIFWYGPTVLPARDPGLIDWVEDRLFTILVGVVFALLVYELLGTSLS